MMQVKTIQEAAAAQPQQAVNRVRKPRHFAQGFKLWFAALLRLASMASFVAFVYWGVRMFLVEDRTLGMWALGCLAASVLLRLWSYWYTHRMYCPLCQGTVMYEKRCLKHEGAKKLPLLSYATTAALQVLLLFRFSCMYCGTDYRLRK
jgi:hypothetical protein